jgi:antitoxin component YwqK of YwqJK toxin-antitoxin module
MKCVFRYTLPIFILLFANSIIARGQKNVQLINSLDVLKQGVVLMDSGAYDLACSLFEQVSRNDTNYVLALFEDAASRESNDEDSMAVVLCDKGLAIPTEYEPDFYKLKAGALIGMKKYNEAESILYKAINKFPDVYQLHFTLGLAYYKAQRYDSAIASLERSIHLNIFHASSHYYLGRCCLEQGRVIPALLSLQFSLILEPLTTRSFSTIQLIERVTENKYEFNSATKVDPTKYGDGPFLDIEALVQSQAALNKEYKPESKINYNIVKQCQLIYDKLRYEPNSDNFWMRVYVPFFTDMRKMKYFDPYSCYIMQSVNDDVLQKQIKKEKKKVDKFSDWAYQEISNTRKTREIMIKGTKTMVHCYYYDSHALRSMGQLNTKGEYKGEWVFFNENTEKISAKGTFDDNANPIGQWEYFYFDGTPKERSNYSMGKRNGLSEEWYENGAIEGQYYFKNDKLDSDFVKYNTSGIPSYRGTYKDNQLSGKAVTYYSDGRKWYELNYSNGLLEGEQREYFANGQLKFSGTYTAGKKNGSAKDYWSNGKLKDEGENKDDKANGHWKFYYSDGTFWEEADYMDDHHSDPVTEYYRNGKKKEEIPYDADGKLNGAYNYYDDDGVKYKQADYLNDMLQHYVYTDKNGKTLSEAKIADKKIMMVNYYPNGVKQSEGQLVNDKREGEWKFYAYNGTLSGTEEYSAGDLEGRATNYYTNGKIKNEVDYKNDMKEGYYKGYYIDGTLNCEGWYVAGKRQGDWYYYNSKEGLESHNYYLNDDEHGYQDYFNSNGNITSEDYYRLGYFDKLWNYDTTGKNVENTYISDKGNGHFVLLYPNGQARVDRTYVAGNNDGADKSHYCNGKLLYDGFFIAGKKQGKQTDYYDNGDLRSVYNYDLGDATGPVVVYFKGEKPWIKKNYFEDEKDGPIEEHYDIGNLLYTGQQHDGLNEGRYDFYSPDSLLSCICFYHQGVLLSYSYFDKNGNMIAPVLIKNDSDHIVTYFSNGNKSGEYTYSNRYLNNEAKEYYSNGNVYKIDHYYYGNLSGPQKAYYSNGTPKAEENYYLGDQDGKNVYYSDNGKVERIENWVLGDKQGPFYYYDKSGNLTKTIVYYDNNEVYEIDK